VPEPKPFQLNPDPLAQAWLEAHPGIEPLVIDYDVQRCCGGGKICQVRVRESSDKDDPARFTPGTVDGGSRILIDRRAAARLPVRFGLTVRGRGRRKRLDLSLEPEQWGDLLYS
jgi:hypothetical protein